MMQATRPAITLSTATRAASQPDVVIVGAGPAGIAAAIQLQRYGIRFLLFERERIGGLLWNANLVENYPGFPNGISGPRLAARFLKHMQSADVQAIPDEVLSVDVTGGDLVSRTRLHSYTSRVVIVASGTIPRPIPVDIPAHLRERVFSTVAPISRLRHQRVVIVGAGDAALDYAMNLLRHNTVTMLNRGGEIQGLPLLWERARASRDFEYLSETDVVGFSGSGLRDGFRLLCRSQGAESSVVADYVVFALGRLPRADFLSTRLREEEPRLLEGGQLYFAGDVWNGLMRQTAIAAGDGLRAAMQIYAGRSTQ
ncbi:MAG: NAD(P)/FAD-dependent oxidoreductase [Chloroflexota bacterium]